MDASFTWCVLTQRTVNGTREWVGLPGSGISRPMWQRSHRTRSVVTRQEHGYRCQKEWTKPRLRTPEQVARRSWLVRWSKPRRVHGRACADPRSRNRYTVGWAQCCHNWACLLVLPTLRNIARARRFALVRMTPTLPVLIPISLYHGFGVLPQHFCRGSGSGCANKKEDGQRSPDRHTTGVALVPGSEHMFMQEGSKPVYTMC